MINKTQKMYQNALKWTLKLSDRRINPKTVACDFEQALINTIGGNFGNHQNCHAQAFNGYSYRYSNKRDKN